MRGRVSAMMRAMTEITRAVTASDLGGLLASATRASVAWNDDGQVAAAPAAFRYRDRRYLIGLPPGLLEVGAEVSVVIDEGPWYFDLRGVRVRGPVSADGEGGGDGLQWFEVRPEREVAWHYGTLRRR